MAIVVDAFGRVVGVISGGDLLQPKWAPNASRAWRLQAVYADDMVEFKRAHGPTAVMTRNPITISPETPLLNVAALLERRRIKRVPALGGPVRLCGQVETCEAAEAAKAAVAAVPGVATIEDERGLMPASGVSV